MNARTLILVALTGGLLWYAWDSSQKPKCDDGSCQVPSKPDVRPEPPKPDKPRRKPWGEQDAPVGAAVGRVAPDGTEPQIDLPNNLHRRNTASKGLGNCVFTSIHHSALWSEVPALMEFPKWLTAKGIPGGGYPSKVAKLIPEMCKDRNVPVPQYVQVEGNDLEILKLACRTGRMPSVTYSRSPTGRYGGRSIAHMVSLIHADDKWFGVLDNNYPGADALEWMSPEQFLRAYSPGWCVILLEPGPPPVPRNAQVYGCGLPRRSGGECPDCGPSPDVVPNPEPEPERVSVPRVAQPGAFAWDKRDPTQWILKNKAGLQIGNYWLEPHVYAGQFRFLVHGGWTAPVDPPIPVEPEKIRAVCDNPDESGVETDKIDASGKPAYWLGAKIVSRPEVMDAITRGQIPDDSGLLRLTIIGPESERRRVTDDLASAPALAEWKGKIIAKSYPADHWAVAELGYELRGPVAIYLQRPDGAVLHEQQDYTDGAEGLAGALRKRDPNYQPAKNKDARKPDPSAPGSIPPWAIPAGAGLLALLLTPKKK